MKPYNIIFIIITSCVLFSCSPEDDDNGLSLPPITTTGENTFGCYVNGKLLVPRDGRGTYTGPDNAVNFYGSYPDGAYNEIDVHDFKSKRTASILIHIENLRSIGEGEYIINESNGISGFDGLDHTYLHCRVYDNKTDSYQYYRSFENSGIITILRFDWPNGIISGTFEGQLKNSLNPDEIIKVTQGRFDFNGYTLPNKKFD